MEGVPEKTEMEILDEEANQLRNRFGEVSDRMLEIMNSSDFPLQSGNPNSEYEKLKSEHTDILEKMEKGTGRMVEISKK